jgi:flagellar biosynthetic protein FliP
MRRLFFAALAVLACASPALAQGALPTIPGIERSDDPDKVVTTLQVLMMLTVLALAPSILVLTTAFTRIVIVLSFVRRSLGTQDLPPNSVIIGLSLILTFMVMAPTFREVKQHAVVPYLDRKISQKEAFHEAVAPMRKFMLSQTRRKDIKLFLDITKTTVPAEAKNADIPTEILVPAFVISELRRAFIMGFAIFLPFLVIDLVVSTTLISMGMLVLPPVLISLPFKILLFILVDGWHLTVGSLVKSFY